MAKKKKDAFGYEAFDKRTDFEIDNAKQLVSIKKKGLALDIELLDIQMKSGKLDKEAVKRVKGKIKDNNAAKKIENKRKKDLKDTTKEAKGAADQVKAIGDKMEKFVTDMPGGGFLVEALGLDGLGDRMKKSLIQNIQKATLSTGMLGSAMKLAMGPIGIIVAAAMVLAGLAFKAFTHFRDMAKELGTSVKQAASLQKELTLGGAALKGTGQSAQAISKQLIDTFGTLESVTAGNIRDVGRIATQFGATTQNVIDLQKSLTDTLGVNVNQSEAIIKNIGRLAQQEGVAAGKVLSDMASNTEKFAEFATDGAMGFAQAAIEAAKIGTNLGTILGAADKLLDFESSLTNEFEAQVLTGKNLNLEKARQLALDGDIEGLTKEIQKQVGSMGDLQAMNVIQRKSLADSIGVTVDQLTKISRGEAVAAEETVQDLQKKTNDILKAGFSEDKDKMDELISKTASTTQSTIYE